MRFITFEEGKGNLHKLNTVFCTSMNIHIVIAILTFLLLNSLGLWFLYNKMVIDPTRMNAAFWVLQFSILTCIVNIVSVPYNACIIAHEKWEHLLLLLCCSKSLRWAWPYSYHSIVAIG